jgi:hypothetical protein
MAPGRVVVVVVFVTVVRVVPVVFTSVFRTVLVLAEADPVVLVDVTVRDAVNLLALSLFCFSVSADGLVGLLRGTRGLAGAVVGRGLGGVDVFGEAAVFDAFNLAVVVVVAEVVLVTPLEAVLLTKVLGLGLGAAVVVVVLVVVVLEDAIAGLGAVGFVGLALAAVAGFGADGLGLSNDFLAVKLALIGALTSPFAKGFFSKLVLVVVVSVLGLDAGLGAACLGTAPVAFAVVVVVLVEVGGFALAAAAVVVLAFVGDAAGFAGDAAVFGAGFLAPVGAFTLGVFFSAAMAATAAVAATPTAAAATAAVVSVTATSGSFTVCSGSEGTEGVSSFASTGDITAGSANSGVIFSVLISVGKG